MMKVAGSLVYWHHVEEKNNQTSVLLKDDPVIAAALVTPFTTLRHPRCAVIVGLFLKTDKHVSELGTPAAAMLSTMSERGPDSAGFAVYGRDTGGLKLTLRGKSEAKLRDTLKADDRRRWHDAGRAGPFKDAGLSISALPLRYEPG